MLEAAAAVVSTPAYVTAALLREADARLSLALRRHPVRVDGDGGPGVHREAPWRIRSTARGSSCRASRNGLLAASWLSSKWAHRAPAGHVLMRAFVGGARDPRALERSDDELVAMTLGALRPLLGISGEPLFTRVYRWERENAQHEVGHLARIEQIDRVLAAHPGLFLTGSGFRGVGIPDCVADGRATARKVVECVRLVASPVRS